MKGLNLTDGQKMLLASVVVVAMSILIAVVVSVGEWRGEISEAHRGEATHVYSQLTRANEQLLQARRAEKDFLLRSEAEYIAKARGHATELEKALDGLRDSNASDRQREQLAQMLAATAAYRDAFDRMAATAVELGLNEDEGLQGKLRDAVHAIESVLKKSDKVPLSASMLMMRRREKDFILRGDGKYVTLLNEETVAFRKLLGGTKGITPAARQEIEQNLEIYRKTFNEYADKALQLAKEKHTVSEASHALERLIEALRTAGLANYSEQTEAAAQFRVVHRWALGAGLLAASLISVVVLWWLNRSIRRSIGVVVAKLQSASSSLGAASAQVSSSSQALAAGASEQAANLEETTSTLEEIASMTRQNSEHIAQADGLARSAQDQASAGGQSIQRMVATISEMKVASDETAKIIKTIDEIAFQTNLLSLNASVEAARAGEAGKGFAVVAEEVRNLAQRSATAAKSTSELVDAAQRKADAGVNVAREVEAAFGTIHETIQRVNELMSNVAAGSKEQAQGVEQITTAAAQLSEVTQSSAANAEETAAASQELASQAEMLNAIVQRLAGLSGTVKAGEAVHDATVHAVMDSRVRHAARPSLPAPKGSNGKTMLMPRTNGKSGNGNGSNGKATSSLRQQIVADWQRAGARPVAQQEGLTDADFTDISN
jgi:methyl-accepting chemotaxis protein